MQPRVLLPIFVLSSVLAPLPNAASTDAAQPSGPLTLGSGLGLFFDDWLIASMNGTRLKLHNPVSHGPVFTFDQPWEGGQSGYVTILNDGKRYRMYYRGGGDLRREHTCVAFSDDAIRWTRPKLGLVEFAGSKDNNIIWTGPRKAYHESHNFSPFIDQNPAAKPDEKWKAVSSSRIDIGGGHKKNVLLGFVSADGIHWRKLREQAIITEGAFDSQNVAFWDSAQAQYVCYSRQAQQGKRSVNRCTSEDFVTWTHPVLLNFGDSPIEQFYTNAIVPYFRQPAVYIGLPMRFIPPGDRDTIGFEQRKTDGLSDAVFMSSHDGLRWNRPFMEAFIRPGLDPLNWGGAHGNCMAAWGIIQSSPTEISLFWADHYDNYPADALIPRMIRGTVRLDGFASVNAPHAGGECVTKLLTFSGKELVLNVSTSAPGSIRVELQDAEGRPLPGYALDDCPPIWGDEIERKVAWKHGTDVSSLAGQPIRLRFVMMDADLYAFRFR